MALFGLIPAGVGLANLIYYFLVQRKQERNGGGPVSRSD